MVGAYFAFPAELLIALHVQNGLFRHKDKVVQIRPDYDAHQQQQQQQEEHGGRTKRRVLGTGAISLYRSSLVQDPMLFGDDDALPLMRPPVCECQMSVFDLTS